MGWNSSMRLLTSPMSWGDISQATGVGGPPYTMGDMVMDSVILNKWSAVKPTTVAAASNVQAFANASARGAAFAAVNYGLTIPSYSSLYNFAQDWRNSAWPYTQPQARWWRTGPNQDLDGYIAHADSWQLGQGDTKTLYAPFGCALYFPSETVGNNDYISMDFFAENINYLVPLAGLKKGSLALSTFYLGLVAVDEATGQNVMYITDTVAGSVGDYVHIEIPVLPNLQNNTDYRFFPALIRHSLGTFTGWTSTLGNSGGEIVSLDAYNIVIRKVATSSNVYVSNTITSVGSGSISGTVLIRNNSGTRIQLRADSLFMYLEAEHIVDWVPTYHAKIEAAAAGWLTSSHTQLTGGVMGDGSDASKIIARYKALLSANTYLAGNNATMTINWTIPYGSDGLGNSYNKWAVALTQIGYIPDGGSMVYRRF